MNKIVTDNDSAVTMTPTHIVNQSITSRYHKYAECDLQPRALHRTGAIATAHGFRSAIGVLFSLPADSIVQVNTR